ncbi:MAG: VOC family protein, partial [Phenylobacterium sp.]|uniref:VOC family protein n=1 Tax=Phenylobacterium sp. TaxID=1871053 RepID=UPI002732E783
MARPDLISALFYQDPRAAIAWLQRAFDFRLLMLLEDASGAVVHAEMSFGSGTVMLGGEWSDAHRSPRSTDGKCTQTVHVHIETDINAHFGRAKASGAEILAEPTYQFYGDV